MRRRERQPSETLSNEEIRRCGVVDIAKKMSAAKLRWYGHVIRRDEGEPSDTLSNEEIRRRCGVVDIAKK
jgi:hypothetical protein